MYTAYLWAKGHLIHLGRRFETAEKAARAYDAKARELFGADAVLNFARRGEIQVQKREPGIKADSAK